LVVKKGVKMWLRALSGMPAPVSATRTSAQPSATRVLTVMTPLLPGLFATTSAMLCAALTTRLTITTRPRPMTAHCSACGLTAKLPNTSGGRGEIAVLETVKDPVLQPQKQKLVAKLPVNSAK
jgi:hypothetical protein